MKRKFIVRKNLSDWNGDTYWMTTSRARYLVSSKIVDRLVRLYRQFKIELDIW